MYRCALSAFVAIAAVGVTAQACAQGRSFPQNALRGSMVFGDYPTVMLNGRAAELSPGARIRNQDNMIVMAATLTGPKWLVHYTWDIGGAQVREVWILRPEEAAVKPWPATPEQAQTWVFDSASQTWARP